MLCLLSATAQRACQRGSLLLGGSIAEPLGQAAWTCVRRVLLWDWALEAKVLLTIFRCYRMLTMGRAAGLPNTQ
jgi:hypothetical protein